MLRIDLLETVRRLLKMLSRLLGEHIDVVLAGTGDAVWIDGDSGMVEQVAMNLCVNARDAMPKGGRLTIAVDRVSLSPMEASTSPEARVGRFAVLSISDTGRRDG